MDFSLGPEALKWREVAREFAAKVVRPVAADLDAQADPQDAWSWEIIEQANTYGLRQAPLPAAYGGSGTDHVTNVTVLEEIAAADLGIGVVLGVHWKIAQMFHAMATPDQRERHLSRMAANPRGLFAASVTEPAAGSDNFLPYTGPNGGLRTRAERVDGGYVINGVKHYISNANRADTILAYARTGDNGITGFILPAGTEGVRIGKVHDKCGERTANNSEIFYDNVFVPDADVLGAPDTARQDAISAMRAGNTYAAACALGIARECFDRTLSFCRSRIQGGKPIIEHQAVGSYLADMYVNVDASRTYVLRAASEATRVEGYDPALSIIPKLLVSERTFDSARRAMELWGGAGVMRANGIEKLLRDAAIWLHSDGTNIIMREKLADLLRAAS